MLNATNVRNLIFLTFDALKIPYKIKGKKVLRVTELYTYIPLFPTPTPGKRRRRRSHGNVILESKLLPRKGSFNDNQ